MDFLTNNWSVILLALIGAADVIVSLTPSKKDDRYVGYLRAIVTTLSNKQKK